MPEMNDACLFVNMICLEKPDGLVFQIGCSGFSSCAEKTGCFGLPNQMIRFWVDITYAFLALSFVNLLSYAYHNTCSHTQLLHKSDVYI
jgi:hypothetical protein